MQLPALVVDQGGALTDQPFAVIDEQAHIELRAWSWAIGICERHYAGIFEDYDPARRTSAEAAIPRRS